MICTHLRIMFCLAGLQVYWRRKVGNLRHRCLSFVRLDCFVLWRPLVFGQLSDLWPELCHSLNLTCLFISLELYICVLFCLMGSFTPKGSYGRFGDIEWRGLLEGERVVHAADFGGAMVHEAVWPSVGRLWMTKHNWEWEKKEDSQRRKSENFNCFELKVLHRLVFEVL